MSVARSQAAGKAEGPDWISIQEALLAGDRAAAAQLARLVTGVLRQLRAYDFDDEWDDLRQEVLIAVLTNAREARLRDPRAFVGYVRIVTRNKFVDRLKQRLRRRERETLPWEDETAQAIAGALAHEEEASLRADVWREVERLPEPERTLVEGVYRAGKTYEEMAADSGIPLGSLKRRLRQALEGLRQRLQQEGGDA
jgi:RNA polymerase sigma-70 factor (ECF subfamily)